MAACSVQIQLKRDQSKSKKKRNQKKKKSIKSTTCWRAPTFALSEGSPVTKTITVASGNISQGFQTAQKIKRLKKKEGLFVETALVFSVVMLKLSVLWGTRTRVSSVVKYKKRKNLFRHNVPGGHINSCRSNIGCRQPLAYGAQHSITKIF